MTNVILFTIFLKTGEWCQNCLALENFSPALLELAKGW